MGPRTAAVALLVVIVGGCTFERRPAASGSADTVNGVAAERASVERAEARAALRRLQELRRRGDPTGVARLLVPDAPILRDGRPARPPLDPGAGPSFLVPGAELGSWRVTVDGRPTGATGAGLLFVLRYRAAPAGDGGRASGALETILLVPGEDGWRVGLLHRTGHAP